MHQRLQQFYEHRVDDYPEFDRTAEVRFRKAIKMSVPPIGAKVLDIGCKNARLLELLFKRTGRVDYVGVDISERNIEGCQKRFPEATFVAGAVEEADLEPGSFDFIYALEVMEHLRSPGTFVERLAELLSPTGNLVLSVPNPYYYMEFLNELRGFPDTEGHLCSFTDANLRAVLGLAGFEVRDVVGTYLLVPRKLRGAFRTQSVWVIDKVPKLFACSRIYRCQLHR